MIDSESFNEEAQIGTVSVLVPTYNSGGVIGDCINSILRQTVASLEIIVCDGGSTDNTIEMATNCGAKVIKTGANRSAQRNAAAGAATGDYLLFIDSDMRLSEKVIEQCLAEMAPNCAALVIPEIFVGDGFWAKVRGFERTFYDNVWYLEAARWYRRGQFNELNGFDSRMVGPEDWDLDQRIRKFGSVNRIKSPIYHFEGKVRLVGLLQRKAHYAGSFPLFRQVHAERASLSLSTKKRIELFIKQPLLVLMHPLLASGLVVLGTSELLIAKKLIGKRLRLPLGFEQGRK